MNGLTDFIISSKLVDLIAILNDSDKAVLSELLSKYHTPTEIGDGTIKECTHCKNKKHIDLFRSNVTKFGDKLYTDSCSDCYNEIRARQALFQQCMKSFTSEFDDEEAALRSCDTCPLAVDKTTIHRGERIHYKTSDKRIECVTCQDSREEFYDRQWNEKIDFQKRVESVITDEHVKLKAILNKTQRKIAEYKKSLRENN